MDELFAVFKIRPRHQDEEVHDGNWLFVEAAGLADAMDGADTDDTWEMQRTLMTRGQIDALPEFEGF